MPKASNPLVANAVATSSIQRRVGSLRSRVSKSMAESSVGWRRTISERHPTASDRFREASSRGEAREQDVVLEVDVLVQVSLERCQAVPERVPGVAAAVGDAEAVGQLADS